MTRRRWMAACAATLLTLTLTACGGGGGGGGENNSDPPVITTEPVARTVTEGSSTSFSVVASGAGISYQWYRSNTAGTDGAAVSGATSATYTIASAATTQAGFYYVIVTNAFGTDRSVTVQLTVNPAPTGGSDVTVG